jgi:hypothetical protein
MYKWYVNEAKSGGRGKYFAEYLEMEKWLRTECRFSRDSIHVHRLDGLVIGDICVIGGNEREYVIQDVISLEGWDTEVRMFRLKDVDSGEVVEAPIYRCEIGRTMSRERICEVSLLDQMRSMIEVMDKYCSHHCRDQFAVYMRDCVVCPYESSRKELEHKVRGIEMRNG